MYRILISREKIYPMPGSNPRVAWKWSYTIKFPGAEQDNAMGPGLAGCTAYAKRRADKEFGSSLNYKIIKKWELS